MNSEIVTKHRMSDHKNGNYVTGSPAEQISMVWPLTRKITSLCGNYDAERRIQRHITNLTRQES